MVEHLPGKLQSKKNKTIKTELFIKGQFCFFSRFIAWNNSIKSTAGSYPYTGKKINIMSIQKQEHDDYKGMQKIRLHSEKKGIEKKQFSVRKMRDYE